MPFPTEITVSQLSRLIGLPDAPVLIDVRADEEFEADPRLIPTALRQDSRDPSPWLPQRNGDGRTVWVTRARPKVVRIACPWLIRRFIDPKAVFLFVPPSEVSAVAEHLNAAPFDVADVFWGDRAESAHSTLWSRSSGLRATHCLGWHLSCAVRIPDALI